ncbi:MAG: endonuclease/exonuclease/phosphatase family protein [Alphaproteobacteria bacterium]|nr:endonuclease/exonuclease/phosphatase family protein [Alphaproteobacteria bacterium]
MTFHLVTLNIKESNAPQATLAFKEQLVQKYAPAPIIFGLQELDINAKRSQKINVPALLAGKDDYRFVPTIEYDPDILKPTRKSAKNTQDPWLYGIAMIVSGATIASSHNIALGPDDDLYWQTTHDTQKLKWDLEPRKAIITEVQLAKGSVWIATTHLSYQADRTKHSPIRERQIEALIKAVSTVVPANAPLILCGDFNATNENPDLCALDQSFSKAIVDQPTKVVKSGPPVQIDHIFFRNLKLAKSTEVITTSFSDHSAVIAHFN